MKTWKMLAVGAVAVSPLLAGCSNGSGDPDCAKYPLGCNNLSTTSTSTATAGRRRAVHVPGPQHEGDACGRAVRPGDWTEGYDGKRLECASVPANVPQWVKP